MLSVVKLVACATNFTKKQIIHMVEQQFLGRWVAQTYRATHAYMAERLRKLQIGYGQFPFLNYLSRSGPSSQEAISQALMFDKATTARAIRKLEEVGYVERRIAEDDHRRYEVKITASGAAAAGKIKAFLKDWNQRLTAGFSPAEKEMIFALMIRVAENARREYRNLHVEAEE